MKQITQEWIAKAEGDWQDALSRYRARKYPNYDSTCFHAQQCAEKYLKARLDEAGSAFSKTHDLSLLLGWSYKSNRNGSPCNRIQTP